MAADETSTAAPLAFTLRQRQRVHRLAEGLWERHGHAGEPCEPGTKGLGSCALDEQRAASQSPSPSVTDSGETYGAVTGGNGRSPQADS